MNCSVIYHEYSVDIVYIRNDMDNRLSVIFVFSSSWYDICNRKKAEIGIIRLIKLTSVAPFANID